MIYNYSSVKEVIGNVVRNTRVTDTQFLLDIPEWIGEAMSFMRTRMDPVYKHKDISINFHAGSLPAGLISVECVEYCGKQLRLGTQRRHHFNHSGYHQSMKFTEWYHKLPYCNDTYFTEMGTIKTPSLCDATVRVHYKSIPTDEEDFPLVPDNANYKQALYWHCRAMMIGAGYEDKTFNYEYCDAQYEKYAARAIAGIHYPSVEEMHSRIQDISRFLPCNFLAYFGMGEPSCGTMNGFLMEAPKSKTDIYVETAIREITVYGGSGADSFTYIANGTEGKTVVIPSLIGKGIITLFLDSYHLEEVQALWDVTPNTYYFNTSTGSITFFNDFTENQIVQGLQALRVDYVSSGTEASSIVLTDLIGQEVTQLFLDNYLLNQVTSLSDLIPNTFIFDSPTGRLTFYQDFVPGQTVKTLYKPKP